MLVDIHVSREEIIAITTAITPAKAVEVMAQMNVVEMMMALQKMRARRTSNQCHVTNLKDNPVQIAADAAEAGIRGFQNRRPRSVSRATRRLTPGAVGRLAVPVPAC